MLLLSGNGDKSEVRNAQIPKHDGECEREPVRNSHSRRNMQNRTRNQKDKTVNVAEKRVWGKQSEETRVQLPRFSFAAGRGPNY